MPNQPIPRAVLDVRDPDTPVPWNPACEIGLARVVIGNNFADLDPSALRALVERGQEWLVKHAGRQRLHAVSSATDEGAAAAIRAQGGDPGAFAGQVAAQMAELIGAKS
jgi:hypothetical protein